VRPAGVKVLRSNVDDVTADRLSRVESQRQILMYLKDVQFTAVQRPLVYCIRLRTVHHLTAIHSSTDILNSILPQYLFV